ncbi:putative protease Do-like 3, mitochondrial [Eutrema salsugineum]|uniref:putative protease Do-like 3, mitochondrial n=1 Tax=Eutrema salsugineum TaxID=72664 RepID=UPI000CED217F|nr:putative protease Do-like 3, mitochondrial [Eutrema salsugineum]
MFRSVRTVSRFSSSSSALAPRFLLLCCNSAPNTATFGCFSASNLRFFSSDKSAPAPSDAAENKTTSVVKNFFFPSIFQHWKKELIQQEKEESGVDEAKNRTPSAIDLGLNSVVKVFTVSSKPRLFQPWQISMQNECSGSGFVISGKKIITNAHVVANHTSVKVRKHGSSTKYKAKVLAIGHECDLAILEVNSDEFWKGMNFLDLGDIPNLQEEVAVVGYPCGGDSISVTKGVVSRFELIEYSHSSTELLAIQIDAAINSGNSGGPVIMGDRVVGVAFESLFWSDGIGYIIPTTVVKHFLNGVEQHVSFGSVNLSYQTMENAQIREYYKMSDEMTGILINEINPLSDAHKFLKKDDVILAIDGVSIGNDSKVHFRKQETITFKHLVSMKKPCETALVKVLREGKEHEFNISVKPVQPLVPTQHFDKHRSYCIYGGVVLVALTKPYIDSSYISESFLGKMPKKAVEQIVIISQILEDDINADYEGFEDLQVKKVNGVEVDNLKHLCQLIEECCTRFLRLDLENEKVLVLNNKSAEKATSRILKDLKIPSAMSEDLRPKQLNRGLKKRFNSGH